MCDSVTAKYFDFNWFINNVGYTKICFIFVKCYFHYSLPIYCSREYVYLSMKSVYS